MIHPSGRKLCALELVRLFRARPLVATIGTQEGLKNHTKTLTKRVSLVVNCILPLGEGLGWGNVSFGSFSLRQRK